MRIVLDIASVDPLVGEVVVDEQPARGFAGWLHLLTLLDRVMVDADGADQGVSGPTPAHLGGQLRPVGDPELDEHM